MISVSEHALWAAPALRIDAWDRATIGEQWTAGLRSELLEGPPCGGPSLSMDPEGRIRTGISAVDSCVLYQVELPRGRAPRCSDALPPSQDGRNSPVAVKHCRASVFRKTLRRSGVGGQSAFAERGVTTDTVLQPTAAAPFGSERTRAGQRAAMHPEGIYFSVMYRTRAIPVSRFALRSAMSRLASSPPVNRISIEFGNGLPDR